MGGGFVAGVDVQQWFARYDSFADFGRQYNANRWIDHIIGARTACAKFGGHHANRQRVNLPDEAI